MALGHSPKISTEGLVFYYDMLNTQKSWKGKPITNLYGDFATSEGLRTNTQFNWNGDNWATGSNPGCPGPAGVNLNKVYKFVSGALNSTWSGNSYGYMYKEVYGAVATTYAFSAWIYVSPDCNISGLPLTVELGTGISDSVLSSTYDLTKKGTWQRLAIRANGLNTNIRWLVYPSRSGVTDGSFTGFFLIAGVQLEENTHASSYAISSRSNTQALIDLTGRNTITMSGASYSSSDTRFRFNGSTDKLTLNTNTLISGTQDYTIEAVFKLSTAGSADYIFGNYGTGNSGGLEYFVASNVLTNYISGYSNSNVTLSANRVYVSCVTRRGSTITHYVNGVQAGTGSTTSGITTNNPFTIGNGHDYTTEAFGGNIYSVKVYNRALTAAEVVQNFNAMSEVYFGYQKMVYLFDKVTVTNNGTQEVSMFKNTSAGSWDGQVFSNESFTAPCTIEFNKEAAAADNGVSYAMIGWNEDPTNNASYNTLDHAAYPFMTNAYHVYDNGTNVLASGTWDTTKKLYVVYDTDGYIRHYNGDKLLYSVNYGTGKTVYVDSSFLSVDSTYGGFKNVRVSRKSWNGISYV